MTLRGKILVELEYEIEDGFSEYVKLHLSHQEFQGRLTFEATSKPALERQIDFINAGVKRQMSPFESIIHSANKLAVGVNDLKDLIKN